MKKDILFIFVTLLFASCLKDEFPFTPAVVHTGSVSNVHATGADVRGDVLDFGKFTTTLYDYGHVWSTSPIFDYNSYSEKKYTRLGEKSSKGSFTSSLTNLLPNTTYYVRAYAENEMGISYGEEATFKTLEQKAVLAVSVLSFDFETSEETRTLTIHNTGNSDLYWNLSKSAAWVTLSKSRGTIEGGNSEDITITVSRTGLIAGDYNTQLELSTNVDSRPLSISMKVSYSLPAVVTGEVSDIQTATAKVSGNITSLGNGAKINQYGHVWSTSAYPTISNSKTQLGEISSADAFTSVLTDLLPNTTYYVRAYATNDAGTSYGEQITFKTGELKSVLGVSAESFDFNASETTKTLTISNTGNTDLAWAISEDAAWIALSKISGTISAGSTESVTITISREGLYAGDYSTELSLSSNAGQKNIYLNMKVEAIAATVTTGAASDIQPTTTKVTGNITNLGNSRQVAQHGHVWSTSANPTTSNNKTQLGAKSSTGTFTSVLTGLQPNTTYYVRAYATNDAGTSYGEQITFKTGELKSVLGVSAESFDFTTSETTKTLTISNTDNTDLAWAISKDAAWIALSKISGTISAGSTESVTITISREGLSAGDYSTELSLSSNAGQKNIYLNMKVEAIAATVTTGSASDVQTSTAKVSGNITSLGNVSQVTQHGHVWSTSANPTTSNNKTQLGAKSSTGTFTSSLSGLQSNTTYYVRAYVTNDAGTSYGEQITFKTGELKAILGVSAESFDFGTSETTKTLTISNSGNTDLTWAISKDAAWLTLSKISGTISAGGTESVTLTISREGLSAGDYSTELSLSSNAGQKNIYLNMKVEAFAATVTTGSVSDIKTTTAKVTGDITALGNNGQITQHGHVWSTNAYPTTSDNKSQLGAKSSTGTFTSSLSGLQPNTTYYVRAYVTNDAGTSYGEQVTFKTLKGSDFSKDDFTEEGSWNN